MKDDIRYLDCDGWLRYLKHLSEAVQNADDIAFADQEALKKICEAISCFFLSAKEGADGGSAFARALADIGIEKEKSDLPAQKETEETILFTSMGEAVRLGRQIGEGGEGVVYKIPSLPGKAAKLFRSHVDTGRKKARIEALMHCRAASKIDNLLVAAFPEELLFRADHTFAGYLMPQVSSTLKLHHVLRKADRTAYFPELTYKGMIIIVYNLAELTCHLHEKGIVMGDMNQNNILLYPDGTMCLIDCDSFDITDPNTGEHFPCTVGTPELLAPELQDGGFLADKTFTKESDCFSLAIHIFRLLMNNADPFGAKLSSVPACSQTAFDISRCIRNGECVYVRDVSEKEIPDWSPSLSLLSDEVQSLFARAFSYTSDTLKEAVKNRPTAKEWMGALLRFYQMPFRQCDVNPFHWYLPKFSECPLCKLDPSCPG